MNHSVLDPETVVDSLELVIFNQIKPEKRNQFLSFIDTVLCPAFKLIRPDSIVKTQVLQPTLPNQDGSLTYVIMMEPAFEDTDYSIQTILERAYSESQAQGFREMFSETLVNSEIRYFLMDEPC